MKKTILTMLLMATTAIAALADDEISVWDGEAEDTDIYLDSKTKTFYVYTAAQFAGLHKKMHDYMNGHHGYDGYTILLMNDIDLNNKNFCHRTIGWDSDYRFGGKLDGQGHTIYNLYIEQKHDNRGIVGWMCGGDIVNLKVENVSVEAGNDDEGAYVGAICGRMQNHSVISHCAVINGKVDVWNWKDDDKVGAICGSTIEDNDYPNTIEYCYAHNVEVRGHKQVGGIVGRVDKDSRTTIRNCYFSGTITHGGDEYFAAIAGERYSNTLENNFYLNRNDGVRGTGNQSKYQGSSDVREDEVKPCTDAELKAPLLFGNDDTEWVYRLDGYPELKVFLRYNKGDTFYEKIIGNQGKSGMWVSGYVKVVDNEAQPYKVELVKVVSRNSTADFTVKGDFNTYFSNQPLRMDALAANIFQYMGKLNSVTLPNTLTSIATPQRHQVQNAFVLNGNVAGCSVQDGVLYDATKSTLITAPKSFSTMTIHQQYADKIADYAFENMSSLRTLYVDTYVPAGTLVDDGANKAPLITLDGENIFNGTPSDLDIYIKDGTANQIFLGKQGPKGYGYCNADKWMHFYDDYQDGENHMFSYFPVSRNGGGMSTLMLGYPVELPEGVTAWWASSLSDGIVHMRPIGTQVVPALTPVLLTYEGSSYRLDLSRYEGSDAGVATDYEGNVFKGSIDPGGHKMTSSEMMSNFFTLGRPYGDTSYDNLGFYRYNPTNNVLPSYVAWIARADVPTDVRLAMDFNEETTAIRGIADQTAAADREPVVYTLQGVRISRADMRQGGIYVVNGKKVVIR